MWYSKIEASTLPTIEDDFSSQAFHLREKKLFRDAFASLNQSSNFWETFTRKGCKILEINRKKLNFVFFSHKIQIFP